MGQQVRFISQTDAKQVISGSTFSIEFILENADVQNFIPPDFSPFKVLSGPSQSYRSSFINGVGTKSVGFSYMLQATRTGNFTIPGASVLIQGKKMTSNPVSLQVLKGQDLTKASEASQIFIRAEVDTTQVYIGQQIMVRYKIYTQVNIENYNILTESNYAGCFAQALDTYKEPVLKEVVQGKEYSSKVLRKVAVFPQQGGKIEIEPMVVQVGVPSRSTVRRGLLSSFGLERKNITSNGVTLSVKSAHDQAPGDFSGAVGNFNVQYTLRPDQVTTDDAISVVVKIIGNGDVKTIRTPILDLPPGFEFFDPKIKDEKMINATDSVRGEKVIEYLIIGHQPGRFKIKPSFTYFDPMTAQYRQVVDSFPVLITQGSGVLSTAADNTLKKAKDAVQPISHKLDLKKVRKPLYLRTWYIGAYVVPLLAFFLLSWRSRNKLVVQEVVDPHSLSKERLKQAKLHMDAEEYGMFYEEIALSLKQFIAYKLKLPVSELSRQKISDNLLEIGINPELELEIRQLLERCDLALYAGLNDVSKTEATYNESVRLITALNEVL
jgi:hypothetical protein